MNQDEVIARLRKHRDRLRPYSVQALYLFGSVARNEASATSDVDLLVEFEASAHIGLFDFVRLRRLLGEILGSVENDTTSGEPSTKRETRSRFCCRRDEIGRPPSASSASC
jgi:predicted nucleotidyltransferase